MRFARFISIYTAILFVLFAASCSKRSLPPSARVQKLGEVEVVTQTPKRVPLGEGKELVIATTVLPNGEIQLELDIDPKPTDGSNAPWGPGRLMMRHVRSGQEYDIPFGDGFVRFTPELKKQ